MAPSKRDLHSPDPLDQLSDPLDQLLDPLDQGNANVEMRHHTLGGGRLDRAPPARLDVRAIRERMRITQRQFAGWFGFPVATLRHWERGNRAPAGASLVLLHVIRDNPRVVLHAVRKARAWDSDCLAAIEPLASLRASPGFGDRHPPLRPRGPRKKR